MKKIFGALFGLLIGISLIAQEEGGGDARSLRFGLKAAPSISWLKPDVKGVENDGTKLGFNYGLMMEFALSGNGNYYISTGIEVSNIGGKLKYANVDSVGTLEYNGTTERAYNLRYVNIPFKLKLRTNEIGYMTYFGEFGLEAGFNIRARAEQVNTLFSIQDSVITGNPIVSKDDELEINDDIRLFRTALVIGAGFEYNFTGNTSVMVGISYNNGFLNALKGDAYEVDPDGSVAYGSDGKPKMGPKMTAVTNYVALNIGIFF